MTYSVNCRVSKAARLRQSGGAVSLLMAAVFSLSLEGLLVAAQSSAVAQSNSSSLLPEHFAGISLQANSKVLKDVAYGPNGGQIMDVYLPPHPGAAPVILMVHGGAWTIGDKALRSVVANKVAFWLPKGYIFISVSYRLLPAADPLEQARDVARSLAFAQQHAASWGGDPSRFVLIGHSAGAHLVDLLASDFSIAAQVGAKPWLGTVSLDTATVDLEETMRAKHFHFYDEAFGNDPSYWAAASPMRRLSKTPQPILLVCSTLRPDRPCPQAERFAAKIHAMNGQASVLPVPLRHSQINENLGLPGSYTNSVESFLRSLGLP